MQPPGRQPAHLETEDWITEWDMMLAMGRDYARLLQNAYRTPAQHVEGTDAYFGAIEWWLRNRCDLSTQGAVWDVRRKK